MSVPDYDQFSEDHQSLLIVVKPIGPQMNQQLFDLIYKNIIKLNELKILNNKINGFERQIRIRYKQSYSIDNNDWGDFQAHRKLIGLITIAQSFNKNEIESISELHKTIHDTYTNTLFDSKCFIIQNLQSNDESIDESKPGDQTSNEIVDEPSINGDNDDRKITETTTTTNSANNLANNEIDPILDFDIGGQLYITSDHTCFTSRVNRLSSSSSSSASSISSKNSQSNLSTPTKSKSNDKILVESKDNYSLPPIINDNDGDNMILNDNSQRNRQRTHSRNKSLDSKLLSITNDNDSHVLHLSSNDLAQQTTSTTTHKRAHSSSTTSLSPPLSSSNCDPSISHQHHSSANEFIQFESNEQCCQEIQLKTKDFLNGLFWTLESKRLDKTREKKDKIPLLMAPCEKKDLIGLDTDTRSFRRKCLGRMQKHIADLSLMTGLPQESFLNYITAIEYLKGVNDKLWLASAYEGLCSASLVLLFPKRWQYIHKLRHEYSFNSNGLINDLLSRKDYEIARTELGRSMKQIALEDSQIDQQIITNKILMKSILTFDQFYDKYKEAASNYALYRGAAVIEFECSFKAAKTLTFFRRYLKASDFIQNAVFISLNQSIEDQIERLLRISQLYETIGFYRKAAFFKRFAALKTVSQAKNLDWEKCYFLLLPALYGYGLTLNPNEYDERLKCGNINWSAIHVQLLQEIITTSLKMQNETLAIRHLSFMLQCLFTNITANQRQEFATKLSSLSTKCGEGSPVPLRLTNGVTIPSVNFTKFPTVVYFKIEPLKPYLKLYKLRYNHNDNDEETEYKYSGPFIYTPLQLNRSPERNSYKNANSVTKMNFYWSEGHIGSISLSLHNYLPIELNITSIIMMTDGVVFEPKHDTSLKIQPNSTCTNISLTGIPRSSGILDILGYKIHTLGIKSDCHLKQLPNAKKLKLPSKFTVEIVQRLPLMCAQCTNAMDLNDDICLAKGINIINNNIKDMFPDCYIGNSNFISLFEGQQKNYRIKLTNISTNMDELIDLINMKIIYPKQQNHHHRNKQKKQKKNFHLEKNLIDIEWDIERIENQLPFGPGLSIEFDIKLSAKGDFILAAKSLNNDQNDVKSNKFTNINESGIQQQQQQPTTTIKKQQLLGSKKLANFINELQSSRKSSNDLSTTTMLMTNNNNNNNFVTNKMDDEMDFSDEISQPKLVELCLQLEYSGGPGLNSGFCRRVNIYFIIEIKSSILITHWDVIQAEQMDECYLVFDTLNATEQEINLNYSTNKEMLIEPKEKCRIPVPIKRCPLNLANNDDNNDDCKLIQKSLLQNHHHSNKSTTTTTTKNIDFLTNIFPTDEKLEAILLKCKQHLLKQINLRWIMQNNDHDDGIVFVEKVPYSNELLKSLLIPPIQSGKVFFLIRLYLVYYQDYQNVSLTNKHNYNINDKIIINGCESLCINELQTKKSYQHNCGLIFLYSGVYKLEICCLPDEKYQQILMKKGNVRFNNNQNGDDNDNGDLDNQHNSLFKCLHTIEITVDD
uniref:Trafficking protein particle complex subunit 9-like n=1 Tax=Dermatophagoides pteronyssinus TaxID=6956 RepID=A0A6P6YAH1_DERPT|nr:trafficking protein particle complex subunit 9-like [Dermatophagoides pteronyssinus]